MWDTIVYIIIEIISFIVDKHKKNWLLATATEIILFIIFMVIFFLFNS